MSNEMTFEEAIRTVLAPWFSSEPPKPDVEASSSREAAGRAIVAAINTKADRGVIRVIVPDAAAVKGVRDYLGAYLEAPGLKDLLKRPTPDGVELKSGVQIEATANPVRLARGVITTISLVERQELPADLDLRDVARAIIEAAYVCPSAAEEFEELMGFRMGSSGIGERSTRSAWTSALRRCAQPAAASRLRTHRSRQHRFQQYRASHRLTCRRWWMEKITSHPNGNGRTRSARWASAMSQGTNRRACSTARRKDDECFRDSETQSSRCWLFSGTAARLKWRMIL